MKKDLIKLVGIIIAILWLPLWFGLFVWWGEHISNPFWLGFMIGAIFTWVVGTFMGFIGIVAIISE